MPSQSVADTALFTAVTIHSTERRWLATSSFIPLNSLNGGWAPKDFNINSHYIYLPSENFTIFFPPIRFFSFISLKSCYAISILYVFFHFISPIRFFLFFSLFPSYILFSFCYNSLSFSNNFFTFLLQRSCGKLCGKLLKPLW